MLCTCGRLGLGHVFTGGCSETNDGCTDTAQMSAPNYTCFPKGAKKPNSCPRRPKNQVHLGCLDLDRQYSNAL